MAWTTLLVVSSIASSVPRSALGFPAPAHPRLQHDEYRLCGPTARFPLQQLTYMPR